MALTGISDAMVALAPPPAAVLPGFLEFARGGVLTAHNAPFDVSFLAAACADCELPWPSGQVVDTVGWPGCCSARRRCPTASSARWQAFSGGG